MRVDVHDVFKTEIGSHLLRHVAGEDVAGVIQRHEKSTSRTVDHFEAFNDFHRTGSRENIADDADIEYPFSDKTGKRRFMTGTAEGDDGDFVFGFLLFAADQLAFFQIASFEGNDVAGGDLKTGEQFSSEVGGVVDEFLHDHDLVLHLFGFGLMEK